MDNNLLNFAFFGAEPAFSQPLYVGRPNIGSKQSVLARIEDMLDRRWLSNHGPFVHELESRIQNYLGVKHCILMCNATVALEITIKALGLTGEVIIPSFTFVATAHSLQWQEIKPVFCDINPSTHNIDPNCIEKWITPKTTGIMGVHLWGRPCDIQSLQKIAQEFNLKLLFDASHAFGASYKGKKIGQFGNAEVFSFHATKFFNTFEGGAVCTNDDELAQKIRLMQNFGFYGFDNVTYIGTNGKMNEASAAMGLTNFESIDEFFSVNERNYQCYTQAIGEIPGLQLLYFDSKEDCNYQYIVVEVNENVTHISRDDIVELLHAEGVIARRYFSPGCHNSEPYKSLFPFYKGLLPETEKLTHKVFALPTGTAMNEEQILKVCAILAQIVDQGRQLATAIIERKSHG